jgi:hypothetical protein
MGKQTIDNVLEELNKLPMQDGEPYLVVKKKKPANYIIKHYAKAEPCKQDFDIDIINIPRCKIEELAEKALSCEAKEATLEGKAERYVHKESWDSAIYRHRGGPPQKTEINVELYLKLNEGAPEFRIKYEQPKKEVRPPLSKTI